MKKLFLFIVSFVMLSFTVSPAATHTLYWGASPSTNVLKYSIYEAQNVNPFIKLGDTTNLFWGLNLSYGTYKWRVTASNQYGESDPAELAFAIVPPISTNVESVVNLILADEKQLISDGSFETNGLGWVLTGNYGIRTQIASEGIYGLAFNTGQLAPNGLASQVIDTILNAKYLLLFDVGINLGVSQGTQILNLEVKGTNVLYSQVFTIKGTKLGVSYTNQMIRFTADSSKTILNFKDISATTLNMDLLLDNVRVYRQLAPQ